MTAEVAKYTIEQIESLELAPGTEHEKLEGWIPELASDDDLRNALEKRKLNYADIARLEFSGKDRAAGKHWEDWVKAYNDRKAAGEQNIALHPDKLD